MSVGSLGQEVSSQAHWSWLRVQVRTGSLAGQDPHICEKLQDKKLLQSWGRRTALDQGTTPNTMTTAGCQCKVCSSLPCISGRATDVLPEYVCVLLCIATASESSSSTATATGTLQDAALTFLVAHLSAPTSSCQCTRTRCFLCCLARLLSLSSEMDVQAAARSRRRWHQWSEGWVYWTGWVMDIFSRLGMQQRQS